MISLESMSEDQERQLEREIESQSIRLSNQLYKEVKENDQRRHLRPIRRIYKRRREQRT